METLHNAVITCTGGRPEALARCIHYMNRQTVKPDVWYVIDDVGDVDPVVDHAIDSDPEAEWLIEACAVIRTPHTWKPGGPHTLSANMRYGIIAALEELGREDITLAFFEDDDWYGPNYLETMFNAEGDLVGETQTRYFNVVTGRSGVMGNNGNRSSLMATVVRGWAIQELWQILDAQRGATAIDIHLWRAVNSQPALTAKLVRGFNTCGIKGLPGRPGIGVGHNDTFGSDCGWMRLEEWIGEDDARWYERFHGLTSC